MSRWTVVARPAGEHTVMVLVEAETAEDAAERACVLSDAAPWGPIIRQTEVVAVISGGHDDALRHTDPVVHHGIVHTDPMGPPPKVQLEP